MTPANLEGATRSEPDVLTKEDHREAAGAGFLVDDQDLAHDARDAVDLHRALVLERERVLLDPAEGGVEVFHELLRTDDEDHVARAERDRAELATGVGGEHDPAVLSHRRGAVDPPFGRGAHLAAECPALFSRVVELADLRPDGIVVPGLLHRSGDTGLLEGLRGALADPSALRDLVEDDPAGGFEGVGDEDLVALRPEG